MRVKHYPDLVGKGKKTSEYRFIDTDDEEEEQIDTDDEGDKEDDTVDEKPSTRKTAKKNYYSQS